MAKQVDIVALGELLIDFTEAGQSKDGRRLFEQNPGGKEVEKQLEEVNVRTNYMKQSNRK